MELESRAPVEENIIPAVHKEIRSLVKEMKDYLILIKRLNATLTNIQYEAELKKIFEGTGITYSYVEDYESGYIRFNYISASYYVNGIGIIQDVLNKGMYPIRLLIADNIYIFFEPRALKDTSSPAYYGNLENSEFINLKKGSTYQFQGQILFGTYIFKENERFEIQIVGSTHVKDKCFIATACYGDLNSPEVITLRQFRNEVLSKSIVGKLAINTYYLLSPPPARLIKRSKLIQAFVKNYFLAPMIKCIRRTDTLV